MAALISSILVIAAIVLGKMLITKSYGTNIQNYFAEHPETTIEELDRDFAGADHIVKNLWIGDKCTYHISYLYPHIIENKDLVWVYYRIL